jgi:TatD DNase family protein
MLIDTHTHLYSEQFAEDREAMIQRAIESGIEKFFLPNIDSSSIQGMKELAVKYPLRCYPMMGLHPCSVNERVEQELELVKKELDEADYHSVGEIGIDLYLDKSFQAQQEMAFRKQIAWAKEKNLPIVIHCREAFDEILSILDEVNDDSLSGIFHCFTGSLKQAKHILHYGNFKLGIGGVVTFKNSGLDKVVEQLSIEDLVLETDSPYLAPAPFRGKRNESSYLLKVAEKVADIYKLSLTKVAEVTSQNALQIFKLHE